MLGGDEGKYIKIAILTKVLLLVSQKTRIILLAVVYKLCCRRSDARRIFTELGCVTGVRKSEYFVHGKLQEQKEEEVGLLCLGSSLTWIVTTR